MTPSPAFGFQQLMTELLVGLAEAVAERPGETEARRFSRHQTAIFSGMAFMPRDALETMLAGQCVIFDHLLRDGARDLLRGQSEQIKLRVRPQLTALGRSFLKHMQELRQLRSRPVDQIARSPGDMPKASAVADSVRAPVQAGTPPQSRTVPGQEPIAVPDLADQGSTSQFSELAASECASETGATFQITPEFAADAPPPAERTMAPISQRILNRRQRRAAQRKGLTGYVSLSAARAAGKTTSGPSPDRVGAPPRDAAGR